MQLPGLCDACLEIVVGRDQHMGQHRGVVNFAEQVALAFADDAAVGHARVGQGPHSGRPIADREVHEVRDEGEVEEPARPELVVTELLESGMSPHLATEDRDSLVPPSYPESAEGVCPWGYPVVFRSGTYLVHRVTGSFDEVTDYLPGRDLVSSR